MNRSARFADEDEEDDETFYTSTPRRSDIPRSPRIPRRGIGSEASRPQPSSALISESYLRKLKYRIFSKSLEQPETPAGQAYKPDKRQIQRLYRTAQANIVKKDRQLYREQFGEKSSMQVQLGPRFESLIHRLNIENSGQQLARDYDAKVKKFGGDLNAVKEEDPARQDDIVKVYFDMKIKQANYNINAYLTNKHETFYNHGILLIGDIAKDLHELFQKMNTN